MCKWTVIINNKNKIMHEGSPNYAVNNVGVSKLLFHESYLEWQGTAYSNNIVPILYTGLKDKNGEEIFEGSVLKVNAECSNLYGKYFCVQYLESEAGFVLCAISDGRVMNNIYCFNKFVVSHYELEVVGNMYENPELLMVSM